jgi:hypothetical protein
MGLISALLAVPDCVMQRGLVYFALVEFIISAERS